MKIRIFGTTVLSVLAVWAFAHAAAPDYNDGIREELGQQDVEQMYPRRPKAGTVEVKRVDPMQVQAAAAPQIQPSVAPATSVQPIYILQQPPQQPQVQPPTNVEATPVKESRAEQLRKQREEVEHQTESKLIERLEDDRLLSEKERADRIFGASASPTPAPAVVPAPAAPVVAPVAIQQQQQQVVTPVMAPTEVTTVSVKHEDVIEKKDDKAKISIGGMAGLGSYPTVNNIKGAYATGLLVDLEFAERLGVEATGVYSTYDVQNLTPCLGCFNNNALVTTLNQWNFTGAFTYHVLSGRVSPVVGALAGYTRRNYSARVSFGPSSQSVTGSSAFDGGFLIGVDVGATEKLTIGADIRYLMNLSYRTDDPLAYYNGVYIGEPLEGLNYYFATINLKLAL